MAQETQEVKININTVRKYDSLSLFLSFTLNEREDEIACLRNLTPYHFSAYLPNRDEHFIQSKPIEMDSLMYVTSRMHYYVEL